MRMSSDSAILWVHLFNSTLLALDVGAGTVLSECDLGDDLYSRVAYRLVIAEIDESNPSDVVAVFTSSANVTAFRVTVGVSASTVAPPSSADNKRLHAAAAAGKGPSSSISDATETGRRGPSDAPGGMLSRVRDGASTSTSDGTCTLLWSRDDPTAAHMGFAYGAGHVRGTSSLIFTTGNNYLQPSGAAAVDALSGLLLWNRSWGENFCVL